MNTIDLERTSGRTVLADDDLESVTGGAWFLAGVLVTVGVAIASAAAGGGIFVTLSKIGGHTSF